MKEVNSNIEISVVLDPTHSATKQPKGCDSAEQLVFNFADDPPPSLNSNVIEEGTIPEPSSYKEYYEGDAPEVPMTKFETFISKVVGYFRKQAEANGFFIGFSQNAYREIAQSSCEEADTEVEDNQLNTTEYKNAEKIFNQKLSNVMNDADAFVNLIVSLYPDENIKIIKEIANRVFENNNNDVLLEDLLSEVDMAIINEKLEIKESNAQLIKEHTPNGKFDKEAVQTADSCDPHGLINGAITHEKGREYMESLVKPQPDGSIYVYLPGNNKQYHYTKEELAERSYSSSNGDGDMTALICAIADARVERGLAEYSDAYPYDLTATYLLFNQREERIYFFEKSKGNITIEKPLDEEYEIFKKKFDSGNFIFSPGGCNAYTGIQNGQEVNLMAPHAYAVVDVIDKDNIILKDSNNPKDLITITFETYYNLTGREVEIPEPVKWDIESES